MSSTTHALPARRLREMLPGAGGAAATAMLLCAGLWLALIGVLRVPGPDVYDQNRLCQLALFLVCAGTLSVSVTLRARVHRETAGLPAGTGAAGALLAVLAGLSCLRAEFPRYALAEVGIFASTGMLALTLAAAFSALGDRAVRALSMALVLMMALYLIDFGLRYAAARLVGAPLLVADLYRGFGHVRFFSQWQSWTLPLAVLPMLTFRAPGWRITAGLLAALWWALHFGSGTRGTTVGLVAASVLTPLLLRRCRAWCLAQLLCAAVGFAVAWAAFVLPATEAGGGGPGRLMTTQLPSNDIRIELSRDALLLVRDHPWLGIGPMHFAAGASLAAHPHDHLLQFASEWGLPFTLVATLGTLILFRGWHRVVSSARQPSPLDPALAASAIAAATHGLFSGVLVTPTSQFMLALVGALMLSRYNAVLAPPARTGSAGGAHGRSAAGAAIVTLAVASLACWLPAVARDVPLLVPAARQAYEEGVRGKPRLWLLGRLGSEDSLQALAARAHRRGLTEDAPARPDATPLSPSRE
jgi:hypothetical protein